MYNTIADIFEQSVAKWPRREALCYPRKNVRWTYREWDAEVNRLANALLAAGVRKGDRVSTFLFNSEELGTCFFACAKIGAVFNPINFRLAAKELAFIVGDAGPSVLLFENDLADAVEAIHEQFPETAFWCVDDAGPGWSADYHARVDAAADTRPAMEVDEGDLYGIMYTSGTTGHPKGVMHRHRDMVDHSVIVIGEQNIHPGERGLTAAPLYHCAELHAAFLVRVHVGGTSVIMHHFEPPEALRLIGAERINLMFCAPTMWNMLLQEDLARYDLSSLRLGLYGAAPMAPALVRACQEKLGIGLVQAYGMTELGPAAVFLHEDEQLTKPGSAGMAGLNHEVRVVRAGAERAEPEDTLPPGEVGEIILRGPCLMIGYYKREEATAKAIHRGWYYSGDLGYLDQDNYLYVADRKDDMIISGGENIYPREIEDVLFEHPGVLDVAVLGRQDEHWGEKVIAFVVPRDENLTAEELDRFCLEGDRLAAFKRPREYHFLEEMPRNASGKTQKFRLREQLTAGKD